MKKLITNLKAWAKRFFDLSDYDYNFPGKTNHLLFSEKITNKKPLKNKNHGNNI